MRKTTRRSLGSITPSAFIWAVSASTSYLSPFFIFVTYVTPLCVRSSDFWYFMYALSIATMSPCLYCAGASMKLSWVAADVNLTSVGIPEVVSMMVCALMPPFFPPVFGCRPTPLKMRLENSEMVVESMMCRLVSQPGF